MTSTELCSESPMSGCNSPSSTLISLGSTFAIQEEENIPAMPSWTLCVHPKGWIYFYNPSLKVVTDQDIRHPDNLSSIEEICSQCPLAELSEQMEVHIYMTQKNVNANGSSTLLNLAVNHVHCVASYELNEIVGDNSCALDPTLLNRCRRLYWNYLWNHPVHVLTPSRALEDASDALTWFYTDNLISGIKSSVPFSKTECEELSRIVAELALPRNDKSIAKTTFLAWLLREICSYRDAEHWGLYTQKDSAIVRERKKPVHAILPPSSPILFLVNSVVNIIFFGIPHTYQAHVKATSEFRGRLSSVQKTWHNYVEHLAREYSEFLLVSTVLLSATVGFLAVPDIPEGAQVAATISTFASLGSIIVGVSSIWSHQAKPHSYTYMLNVRNSYTALYGYAILLSLPAVLLVWAILLFSLSVVIFATQGVGQDTALWRRFSIWLVLAVFIIFLMIVTLALYTFSRIWKFKRRGNSIWNRLTSMLDRFTMEPVKECV